MWCNFSHVTPRNPATNETLVLHRGVHHYRQSVTPFGSTRLSLSLSPALPLSLSLNLSLSLARSLGNDEIFPGNLGKTGIGYFQVAEI